MSDFPEDKVLALFNVAGIPTLGVWELPNGYWPRPRFEEGREEDFIRYHRLREASPWWLVKTPRGLVEIGWRKRVISIDWTDTGVAAPDLTSDPVTMSEHLIHASSALKAVEYLAALWRKMAGDADPAAADVPPASADAAPAKEGGRQ